MAKYLPLPNGDSLKVPDDMGYDQAMAIAQQKFPELFQAEAKPESGFTPALKAGFKGLQGDIAALAGRSGLMDLAAAEEYKRQKEAEAKQIFAPTQEGWTEAPLTKIAELAGGSLPYMAAPLAAGAAAVGAPVLAGGTALTGMAATLAGGTAAGLTSAAQFTGSNLSRQMEEGKSLGETDLGSAALASIPQAALDVVGFKMIPGIRRLFGAAGKELTEAQARQVVDKSLKSVIADYTLSTGKTMGAEGLTEAGQQVFERLQAGLSLTDEKARDEYLENFIGGAVLGGIMAPAGRFIERGDEQAKAQEFLDKQAAERQKAEADAAEAEANKPENLIQLSLDYNRAKAELAGLNQQVKALGAKKSKTPGEKAQYEALKAQRDALADNFKPLAQEYNKRKDAISAVEAQAETSGAGQAAATAALPSDLPEAIPYQISPITQLMDAHEQVGKQISGIEDQLAAGPDVNTQEQLLAQMQQLQQQQQEMAASIQQQGGTTDTMEAHQKAMAAAEKLRLEALEKGDWKAATAQAEKIKVLQAQLPYLQELQGWREQKGQTRDLFTAETEGAGTAPTTTSYVNAEGKPLFERTELVTPQADVAESEKERAVYGEQTPEVRMQAALEAFGLAEPGPRGLMEPTETESDALRVTSMAQLRKEQNAQKAVAEAEDTLRAAHASKDSNAIAQAAQALRERKTDLARIKAGADTKAAVEEAKTIKEPFKLGSELDLFGDQNVLNEARSRLESTDPNVRTEGERTLFSIYDEKTKSRSREKTAAEEDRKKLIESLDNRLGLGGSELATKTGQPLKSVERTQRSYSEAADAIAALYPEEAADHWSRWLQNSYRLLRSGTFPDAAIQEKFNASPEALAMDFVLDRIAELKKKVETKQGREKQSKLERLLNIAQEHEAVVRQLESNTPAKPLRSEKVAALAAKFGKGEAPTATRGMDAAERKQAENKKAKLEAQFAELLEKIAPVKNEILNLYGALFNIRNLETRANEQKAKRATYGTPAPKELTARIEEAKKELEMFKASNDAEGVAQAERKIKTLENLRPKMSRETKQAKAINEGRLTKTFLKSENLNALARAFGKETDAFKQALENASKQLETLTKKHGADSEQVAKFKAAAKEKLADKMLEEGQKTEDYKAALADFREKMTAAVTAGEQEVVSKRTPQETRKQSGAPRRLRSATPESRSESGKELEAAGKRALPAQVQSFQRASGKGEKPAALRGVETESVDLSKDQVSLINSNKVQSVLLAVSNDDRYDPFTRAVAKALRPFLDNTNIRIDDKVYDGEGREVLGSAISTQILISRDGGLSVETLLHEATHAAAERIVVLAEQNPSALTKEQTLAINELKAIHARVKNDSGITSTNAKGSLSEFIAEVMSNRNLQKQLGERKWRLSDMWNGIKSAIMRMLGLEKVETMFGASVVAIEQLFVPSSVRNLGLKAPETVVSRKLSAKDIAALHSGSNSMRQFSEQFGDRIKQKDRTPEDVERIAQEAIDEMVNSIKKVKPLRQLLIHRGMSAEERAEAEEENKKRKAEYEALLKNTPKSVIALPTEDTLDYKSATIMSDGKPYDENNPLHFVEAEVSVFAALKAQEDLQLREQEAKEISDRRKSDFKQLVKFFEDNYHNYTLAETALVLKAAAKYSVIADKSGRLKLVEISKDNRHNVAVVGADAANAIIEELRAGKGLKDAFITGLQKQANRAAVNNERKNGWQKFDQSDSEEAAIALNEGAANTSWCTGAGLGHARGQIKKGDFYIYYKNGRPEVAVRMYGADKVDEVRGNTPDQSLNAEQQKIAQDFLEQKAFKGADEYLSDMRRKATLIAVAKGEKSFTAEDLFAMPDDVFDNNGKANTNKLLRFSKLDGYEHLRPDASKEVVKFFADKLVEPVFEGYKNGNLIYSSLSTLDFNSGGIAKVKFGGKTFEVSKDDLKMVKKLLVSNFRGYEKPTFPNLTNIKDLNMFSGENRETELTLPKLKQVESITAFGKLDEALCTLVLPSDAKVGTVFPIYDAPTQLRIEGARHIQQLVLHRGDKGSLHLDLPDTQYFATVDDYRSVLVTASQKAENELVAKVLSDDKVSKAYAEYDFAENLDEDDTADDVYEAVLKYNKTFGDKTERVIRKLLTPAEFAAFNKSWSMRLMDQWTVPDVQLGYIYSGLEETLPEKRFRKVLFDFYNTFFGLKGDDKFVLPDAAVINAPNFIAETPPVQTLTEAPEQVRFAPKNVGVQEEKPGVYSFKRKREETSITSVAQEPSFIDKFFGNLFGLAGRVQFVDQYAALDEVAKRGMSAGQISSAEATNAQYLLRFGQQVSQFAGQFMTNGAVVLETIKENGIVKSLYRSIKGTSMMDVAQALNAAKLGNDTEQEAMFTMYLAGERAKQVGWNKLNFADPAKAQAEYQAVMNKLAANPQAAKAFAAAKQLYQQYNAGLLDFLVQTGALTAQKAAELKAITYVPFYRVAANGEVQLMIDKEHPIRIANIKDQPQLKELVGGNTAIMPVFASAAQNTFMITRMGLRNQAVKETAFMLQKLGMTKAVRKGHGPTDVNTVRFFMKGEPHYVIVDTDAFGVPAELVVRGMEGVKTTLPAIVKALGVPATLLRNFVVRNPAYAVRQVIRDPLTAWFTTGTDSLPVLSSMKELATMVAGRSETERKLMETGAVSSNVYTGDERDMAKFLKDVSTGRSGWDKAVARLDAFALQGDAATRAVIYRDSLAKGMSEQEALLRTMESMNFSRRGVSPSIQFLNTLIPFFNAQIQGLDVLYRAFKGDMPFSKQLEIRKKLIQRGVMLGAMTLVYAAMMEDDEAYKRARPEERYGNWFVYVPGVSEPVRVPIPFELGYLFKALPEAVWNMAAQDEKASYAVKGIGKLLAQSNPLSLPQAIKPLTEVYLGKSFFGGDIESQREKQMLPEERYRENTTELSKLLGSVTGKAGVSPISLDYLIRGYTGGLGVALVQLANPVLASDTRAEIAKPSLKPSKTPFIGGLFQPVEGRGTLDEAYDRMTEIRQVKGTFNRLVEEGRRAEALEFAQRNANELAMMSISGKVQQQLGQLAKVERQIRANPSMTTEQKDARLKQLDEMKVKIARQFTGR